ncbi:MAG: hypothetical protein JNM36_00775 [Chitinophagales bacterium]|nr:hypothetical protein [Chitinophagales bacterium]
MKNLLTLTLCCWLAFSSLLLAQNQQEDVVYLKNGGFVRGKIVENIPNQKVVIESSAKTVYTFNPSEIERITQETRPTNTQPVALNVPKKGFYHLTQGGLSFSGENNTVAQKQNASLMTVNGYKFFRFLGVGIAAGVEWYPQHRVYPISLDVRGDILPKGIITPYYFLQAGFAPGQGINAWNENNNYKCKGGVATSSGLGIKLRTNSISWVMDVGFRYQQVKDQYNDWWWGNGETSPLHEREFNYQRLFVRTGIAF